MLFDSNGKFYFDNCRGKGLNLEQLALAEKSRFRTPERARAPLREWDNFTLRLLMSKNPKKVPFECLDLLVSRLCENQVSTPVAYRNDTIVRDRLLNVVSDVDAFRLAHQNTSETW